MSLKPNKLLTHTWFAYDEQISSLQKNIRLNNQEGASYAACDIMRSGFAGHVWNRLFTIIDEDIGYIQYKMRIKLVELYEETAQYFKKDISNAWKMKEVRINILRAIEMMTKGEKTRIASHMSPSMFSSEIKSDIKEKEKEEKGEEKKLKIKECSDVSEDINSFYIALKNKNEKVAGYHLNRLILWNENNKEFDIQKYSWMKDVGLSNRKKTNPSIFIWYIFHMILKNDNFYKCCFTSLYQYELGSSRLTFFSLILYHCRDKESNMVELDFKDNYKNYPWYKEMFKDKSYSDKDYVLLLRSYYSMPIVAIDKHTKSGKGQDTLAFLNKILDKEDIDWFSEEEKKKSHRKKAPKQQGSSKFFHEVASNVAIESKIDNPYKKISYDMYLNAEKELGVRKAKTREIGKAYYNKYMKRYGECREDGEKGKEEKKEKIKKKIIITNSGEYSIKDIENAPTGQKRTSKSKKYVFIPIKNVKGCRLVFKGIYKRKEREKVLKTIERGYIMSIGKANTLLPLGIKDKNTGNEFLIDYTLELDDILKKIKNFISKLENFYVIFPNMAISDPKKWKIEDYKDFSDTETKLVDRNSLGLTSIHRILDDNKKGGEKGKRKVFTFLSHAFPDLFKSYLYGFLLGIGDLQLGNTLVLSSDHEIWRLIDFEDNSHKKIEETTIDDLLFRKSPSKDTANIFRCCYRIFKKEVLMIVNNINPQFEIYAKRNDDYRERLKIAKTVLQEFYKKR